MSEASYSPKRRRSPSYPAIDLEAAIERARTLYAAEGRNTAPNEAIMAHWGYSPTSGPGFGTLGALKRFGLLQAEGPGKSRLSENALRIILDEREDSSERDEAIKQAALAPAIHKEIWDKYPDGLPSDATLRHFLRLDKGFTDAASDDLIGEFRSTVDFARLSHNESLSPSSEVKGGSPVVTSLLTPRRPDRPQQGVSPVVAEGVSVPLPLSATEWVTLNGPFPLSEGSWEQLLRVLQVMKPGLVAPASERLGADEDDPDDPA